MTKKPSPQIAKFQNLAREIGADESEERFDDALAKVGRRKDEPTDLEREMLEVLKDKSPEPDRSRRAQGKPARKAKSRR